jgi:hypothetical protein
MAVQDRHVVAAMRSPYPDGTVLAGGSDPLPVRAVDSSADLGEMSVVRWLELLAIPGVPLPDGPVCRGRHEARAVRAERGADDLARVPPAGGQHRAGGRVPQPCRPILATGGESGAVGTEDDCPDGVVVAITN